MIIGVAVIYQCVYHCLPSVRQTLVCLYAKEKHNRIYANAEIYLDTPSIIIQQNKDAMWTKAD